MKYLTSEMTKTLQPKRVWKYFYEISQIPRDSGDEQRAREYVKQFAHKRDLSYFIDAAGNIVVKRPAAAGKERSAPVILQGHLDMVCVKDPDASHDFSVDPIKLVLDGEWITADGTTLGADNGIAVAFALAVLEDETLSCGPIEALFTVSEETGLDGAFKLDPAILGGTSLINLDSEQEGVIYVGSAGGGEITASLPAEREMTEGHCLDWSAWEVTVTGLTGGHSGGDIHLGRANAVAECFRFLYSVSSVSDIRIASADGGSKRNVIPSECRAVFLVPPKSAEAVSRLAEIFAPSFAQRFGDTDPKGSVKVTQTALPDSCLTVEQSRRLVHGLFITPHGVDRMSTAVPGMVETSTNLASVKTEAGEICIVTSQRSSIESARNYMSQRVSAALAVTGAAPREENTYPAWTPDPSSPLPELVSRVYERMYRKKPTITAIHAGLECGVIKSKAPEIQAVSMGPTIHDAHSTDERMFIPSVQRVYEFLRELLQSC